MKTRPKEEGKPTRDELDDLLGRVASLPTLDPRPADRILGYDEDGIPESSKSDRNSTPQTAVSCG